MGMNQGAQGGANLQQFMQFLQQRAQQPQAQPQQQMQLQGQALAQPPQQNAFSTILAQLQQRIPQRPQAAQYGMPANQNVQASNPQGIGGAMQQLRQQLLSARQAQPQGQAIGFGQPGQAGIQDRIKAMMAARQPTPNIAPPVPQMPIQPINFGGAGPTIGPSNPMTPPRVQPFEQPMINAQAPSGLGEFDRAFGGKQELY